MKKIIREQKNKNRTMFIIKRINMIYLTNQSPKLQVIRFLSLFTEMWEIEDFLFYKLGRKNETGPEIGY